MDGIILFLSYRSYKYIIFWGGEGGQEESKGMDTDNSHHLRRVPKQSLIGLLLSIAEFSQLLILLFIKIAESKVID